jgi:hypothetical protein
MPEKNDGESSKLIRVAESPIEVTGELARAFGEINKHRSLSLATEMTEIQKFAANQIASQLSAAYSVIPMEYQTMAAELSRTMGRIQHELSQAAEFARASLEKYSTIQPLIIPRFEFPIFPKLTIPEWPQIDWEATMKSFKKGVVRMADRGWTAPDWMIPRDAGRLGNATDEEIDAFFMTSYLGTKPDEGQLKRTSANFLKSDALKKWEGCSKRSSTALRMGRTESVSRHW